MRPITIPNDHVIMSLDLESMYPNTPRDKVTEAVGKRFHHIRQTYDMKLQDLLNAIGFLMNNTFCQFGRKYYLPDTWNSHGGSQFTYTLRFGYSRSRGIMSK
ncbi:hypothetical protein QAD02_020697 [Eretmocerus hayati]|uniref:Uncharacterized protein n=1 Tax=Eretmocerus hayati TaxID=131215 RepID=A0ACC2PQP4_9HYME|nr:hypothetical protein QAD02_020697 [Eretmocerus hayati]